MVILDTCALIQLCLNGSLSQESLKHLTTEDCIILSISFAEAALKQKRGKLPATPRLSEVYGQFQKIENIKIVDIGFQEWFDSIELDWSHKDPVDRLIVAYAMRQKIPIMTSDKLIKKFYKNVIW